MSATTSSTSRSPWARTATASTATSCRMEEMRQSVYIIQQAHRQAARARRAGRHPRPWQDHPPSRTAMKTDMESLIHHFKLYTEGFHVPEGEVYCAVEAPKGEFGVYLVADGTNKPYRAKLRAPGLSAPAGDGPYLQGAPTGRRGRDHRHHGRGVRRDRPVSGRLASSCPKTPAGGSRAFRTTESLN